MNEKQRLRAELRSKRREFVEDLPEAMRGLIFLRPPEPVVSLVPDGGIVGLYHATQLEAPTASYARWLFENGRRIALPWFTARESPMRFRIWANPFAEDMLAPGPYGALQPLADAEEVVPDVAFVPMLGFTAGCERLGQGGGHYDRWLARHPGVATVGLAWDCQLVDSLPLEPHDRVLDAVVTPTRFYEATR